MQFKPTPLSGVVVAATAIQQDARGSFRRVWCQRDAEDAALPVPIVQTSLSVTQRRGTLRGLHFQSAPSREGKLVTCVRGRIFDVALDLRPRSDTFLRHFAIELREDDPRGLFIPPGCAHGFLTLTDDCSILYMMTDFYEPTLSNGVRWNDAAFGILWPEPPKEMLERDRSYPDFDARIVDGFASY
jgi:dTDP-4-dehydrorhamnose 3,5-epimerase